MESSPEFYHSGYYNNASEKRHSDTGDHFIIEDLLDFSNEDVEAEAEADADVDAVIPGDGTFESIAGNSTDSSNLSTFSGSDPHFSTSFANCNISAELCVPYDDLAELEWLSNLGEESFSSDDLQKLQLISGMKGNQRENGVSELPDRNLTTFRPKMPVPGKARSKRNRAAPCNWSSRLLVLSPTTTTMTTTTTTMAVATSSSESDIPANSPGKKMVKGIQKKKEFADNTDGRKCLHCATDRTPQWRTGPMGPKTLCNACGVRYKSGRLVPEYRPASSPTFTLAKHSNSHRKVLELRRQKEMQMSHHQQFLYPNALYSLTSGGGVGGGGGGDDYLIHHQTGPDFRQLI